MGGRGGIGRIGPFVNMLWEWKSSCDAGRWGICLYDSNELLGTFYTCQTLGGKRQKLCILRLSAQQTSCVGDIVVVIPRHRTLHLPYWHTYESMAWNSELHKSRILVEYVFGKYVLLSPFLWLCRAIYLLTSSYLNFQLDRVRIPPGQPDSGYIFRRWYRYIWHTICPERLCPHIYN